MQNNEETIAKYAVDANLFRLGSTNPKKNSQPRGYFLVGSKAHTSNPSNLAHQRPSQWLV